MTLIERLLQLSRLWCKAQDRSLSRLSTIVANDGKLLTRLEEGKTCTVSTFERFLDFFREPGNWPEEAIPADAAALLDEVEIIATGADPQVGRELQISALDLMAPATPPQLDPSATIPGENICPGSEADSPRPFPAGSALPPTSSSTSLTSAVAATPTSPSLSSDGPTSEQEAEAA